MPWNGSGTYSLPPAYSPEVNGTVIDATRYNGLTTDLANGVTNALAKDGQNVPTANLPMGGFKHTGAGDGSAAGQYLVYGQSANAALTRLGLGLGTAGAPSLFLTGDSNTGIWSSGGDTLNFSTGGSEAWRIDSVGRFLSGGVSAQTTFVSASTVIPFIQLNGTTVSSASAGFFEWASSPASSAGYQLFARSRNATPGSHTIVQNGDALGRLSFAGSDGTQFVEAARIQVQVAGTPGALDMPGSLSILTTPDGTSAPTTVATFNSDNSTSFAGAITSASTARFNDGAYGVLGVRESGAYGGAGPSTAADSFVIEANVNGGLSILTPDANSGGIYFGDATSNTVGRINYNHSTDILSFRAGGTDKLFLTGDGRLYGSALHNNTGAVTGTTNQYIASGTYTPTLFNTTNISTSTAGSPWMWVRVGNVVHVAGIVEIQCTAAGGASSILGISIPIASDFTLANQLVGHGTCTTTTGNLGAATISGQIPNDRAIWQWRAETATSQFWYCSFVYEVL